MPSAPGTFDIPNAAVHFAVQLAESHDAVLQTIPSAQRVLAESCGNLVQVEGERLEEGAAEGMLWMHLCS